MEKVLVYGADWCSMTRAALAHLQKQHVPFEYIDIDKDRQAARWVAKQNGGRERKPTFDIGGDVLSEPTSRELDEALARKGLLKSNRTNR